MYDFIKKNINTTFVIMFGIIYVSVVVLGGFVDYNYKRYFPPILNISFFLLIIFGVLQVSKAIIRNYKNVNNKINDMNIDKVVIIFSIGLFFLHMAMLSITGVVSITDAGLVAIDANMIANGDVSNLNNSYFSRYPNNLLITLIQSVVIKFNNFLGLFNNGLVLIIIINSIICIITLLMMYSVIKHFMGKKYGLIGFIIGAVSFGISPWVLTSYSDPMGLLFPMLLLYIYIVKTETKTRTLLKFIAIIVIASIGYSIKPQTYVMFIAIVIVECIRLIKIRKALLLVPLLLSSVVTLSAVQNGVLFVAENVGYDIDAEQSFGFQHWFMMGLNDEYDGGYSHEDANFSASFDNSRDRNRADMEEAMNRLKEMGFIGTAIHMVKKLLMNFNDGTFTLYLVIIGDLSIYGRFLMVIEQICWLLILGMCFASALFGLDKFNKRKDPQVYEETDNFKSLVMLSIIGLTMFVMLFEGRARYIYTFAPVFAILATFGVKSVYDRIEEDDKVISKYNGRKIGCVLGVVSSILTVTITITVTIVFINSYLSSFVETMVKKYPNLLEYGTVPELMAITEIVMIIAVTLLVVLNIIVTVFTIVYLKYNKFRKQSGLLNLFTLSPINIAGGILIIECDD